VKKSLLNATTKGDRAGWLAACFKNSGLFYISFFKRRVETDKKIIPFGFSYLKSNSKILLTQNYSQKNGKDI
jgi:hypothetical protein